MRRPLPDEVQRWADPDLVEAAKKMLDLEALAEALSKLPDQPEGLPTPGKYKPRPWTTAEDLSLVDFWPRKVQSEVARVLRRSVRACIDRYELLTKKES